MQIPQHRFFDGLNFEKHVFNQRLCYKGPDGFFYRIGCFSDYYVIEDAEDIDSARADMFEDADLFEKALPEKELIRQVQEALRSYVTEWQNG